MSNLSRFLFGFLAIALIAAAVALVGLGVYDMWRRPDPIETRVLDMVGYLIIAIAIFDVAKYLFEEEAVRERKMRHVAEARRSLTRFLSSIILAVFLEAIVLVFKVVRGDFTQMAFPVMLLLTGVVMLIGLGAFQHLTAGVEKRVAPSDDESEGNASAAGPIPFGGGLGGEPD